MLAALLATRTSPPPPALYYGNQFVAATTTFACIFLAKRAAFITSNPTITQEILLSTSGHEAIVRFLDRMYRRLCSQLSADNPLYLSNTIASTIVVLTQLNGIIQSLPVPSDRVIALADIRRRMRLALNIMLALALPTLPL